MAKDAPTPTERPLLSVAAVSELFSPSPALSTSTSMPVTSWAGMAKVYTI